MLSVMSIITDSTAGQWSDNRGKKLLHIHVLTYNIKGARKNVKHRIKERHITILSNHLIWTKCAAKSPSLLWLRPIRMK